MTPGGPAPHREARKPGASLPLKALSQLAGGGLRGMRDSDLLLVTLAFLRELEQPHWPHSRAPIGAAWAALRELPAGYLPDALVPERSGLFAGRLGYVRGDGVDFLFAEPVSVGGHAPSARLDFTSDGLDVGFVLIEVGAYLPAGFRGSQRVAGTAASRIEDLGARLDGRWISGRFCSAAPSS